MSEKTMKKSHEQKNDAMDAKDAKKKHAADSVVDSKIAELTDDLQRLQAEFENFKKRSEKDSEKACSFSKIKIIEKMLPVMDTFESAIAKSGNEERKGLCLVYEQLKKILISEGLKEIEAKGIFNPDFHEAMMQQESDDYRDDEIIAVIQKGYTLNGFLVRPSKVKLNKKPKNEEE